MILYKIPINERGRIEIRDLTNIIKINLILELVVNEYIIGCEEGIFHFKGEILNISQNDLTSTNLISKEYYIEATILYKRILVLINNKNNGSNVHIYDLTNNNKIYEINKLSLIIISFIFQKL